jgi:outer membrane protein assembly factor BamB
MKKPFLSLNNKILPMMKNPLLNLIMILLTSQVLFGQVLSEWRGQGRTGVYPETGLLTSWPETGPEMLWVLDSLPNGYSSMSVAHNTVYFTGIVDSMDVLIAVDRSGVLKWETPYGRSWTESYNPSRCTPTIDGDRAYVSSGLGDVACINALTGEMIWTEKISEDYQGTYGRWGISESPLVLDDRVFFTPGGNQTTMVALDKMTGKALWASESLEDEPSYTSPLLIEWADTFTVVNLTRNYVFGINPLNGNIRWTFDFGQFAGGEWRSNNQTNTPLFEDGKMFITSGYDHNCVQIELSEKGDDAYFHWVDSTLDVHHGGAVKVGNYIYGASWEGNRNGHWVCLEWNTGELQYEAEWENKGSIIYAEGMLYCYEEKNGNIALVKATPEGFDVISSFKIEHGKGPHWAHPVIQDGVLYIRHGQALMAYNISTDSNQTGD